MVGVPVPSVQFNRSILSVNTVGPSSRSRRALKASVWRLAGGRGRQEEGNSAYAVAAPSLKRQKRLPILKTPGHRAQKPRFCARNARKRGFRSQKKHKNLDFVLEMPENGGSRPQKRTKTPILCSGRRGLAVGRDDIGIGKRNRCLPANHRAHSQNAKAS